MKDDSEKISNLIINVSGILIPVSLASITFVGANKIVGTAKNLLMFTIPAQILLLIVALWIGLNIYSDSKNKESTNTHLKYSKTFFIIALFLILINHMIVLFSST